MARAIGTLGNVDHINLGGRISFIGSSNSAAVVPTASRSTWTTASTGYSTPGGKSLFVKAIKITLGGTGITGSGDFALGGSTSGSSNTFNVEAGKTYEFALDATLVGGITITVSGGTFSSTAFPYIVSILGIEQ